MFIFTVKSRHGIKQHHILSKGPMPPSHHFLYLRETQNLGVCEGEEREKVHVMTHIQQGVWVKKSQFKLEL